MRWCVCLKYYIVRTTNYYGLLKNAATRYDLCRSKSQIINTKKLKIKLKVNFFKNKLLFKCSKKKKINFNPLVHRVPFKGRSRVLCLCRFRYYAGWIIVLSRFETVQVIDRQWYILASANILVWIDYEWKPLFS